MKASIWMRKNLLKEQESEGAMAPQRARLLLLQVTTMIPAIVGALEHVHWQWHYCTRRIQLPVVVLYPDTILGQEPAAANR